MQSMPVDVCPAREAAGARYPSARPRQRLGFGLGLAGLGHLTLALLPRRSQGFASLRLASLLALPASAVLLGPSLSDFSQALGFFGLQRGRSGKRQKAPGIARHPTASSSFRFLSSVMTTCGSRKPKGSRPPRGCAQRPVPPSERHQQLAPFMNRGTSWQRLQLGFLLSLFLLMHWTGEARASMRRRSCRSCPRALSREPPFPPDGA